MITTVLTKQEAQQNPYYADGLDLIPPNPTNYNNTFFIAHGRIGSLIYNLNNYLNWCELHGENRKDGTEMVIIVE